MATNQERLIEIIAKQLGVDEENVTPDASFMEDLGADSLDTVELVMALEEEFDIEIPDSDAEKIQTVQDALSYLDEHVVKVYRLSVIGLQLSVKRFSFNNASFN